MLPTYYAEIKAFTNASHHALAEAARAGIHDPAIVVADISKPLASLVVSRLPAAKSGLPNIVVTWASKPLIADIMGEIIPGAAVLTTIKEQMAHSKPYALHLDDQVSVGPWCDGKKIVVSLTHNDPCVHPTASRRSALIDGNLEKIEFAYQKVTVELGKPALILILDLTDDLGRTLATNPKVGSAQHLDRFVREITAEGNIPTMIVGMGRWQGYKMMRAIQHTLNQMNPMTPRTSEVVEQLNSEPPDGCFWCMCIGSGGKQLAHLKIPP